MAASAWRVYNEAKKYFLNGTIDLDAATAMRVKIVKGTSASKVSDYTRSTFASCGTAVSFKNADAKTPTSVSIRNSSNSIAVFDMGNVVFTASASLTSLQYAVIGLSNSYCIAWCKLSTAAFALSTDNTLTIKNDTNNGIFALSGGTT